MRPARWEAVQRGGRVPRSRGNGARRCAARAGHSAEVCGQVWLATREARTAAGSARETRARHMCARAECTASMKRHGAVSGARHARRVAKSACTQPFGVSCAVLAVGERRHSRGPDPSHAAPLPPGARHDDDAWQSTPPRRVGATCGVSATAWRSGKGSSRSSRPRYSPQTMRSRSCAWTYSSKVSDVERLHH